MTSLYDRTLAVVDALTEPTDSFTIYKRVNQAEPFLTFVKFLDEMVANGDIKGHDTEKDTSYGPLNGKAAPAKLSSDEPAKRIPPDPLDEPEPEEEFVPDIYERRILRVLAKEPQKKTYLINRLRGGYYDLKNAFLRLVELKLIVAGEKNQPCVLTEKGSLEAMTISPDYEKPPATAGEDTVKLPTDPPPAEEQPGGGDAVPDEGNTVNEEPPDDDYYELPDEYYDAMDTIGKCWAKSNPKLFQLPAPVLPVDQYDKKIAALKKLEGFFVADLAELFEGVRGDLERLQKLSSADAD